MDKGTFTPVSRKKSSGKVLIVALLTIHGLLLLAVGLIAFFGGFVGIYEISNGRATPGTIIAVLGVFLAWIFLLAGILSLLCAYGLWGGKRWAFWLAIALEVTTVLLAGFTLRLQLFTPWPIALSMAIAGSILLLLLITINPRTLSDRY
jgi:hypothetical protein